MLNEKQKRFAAEYIVDLNATQAAIRAGYAQKTAYSQGQRLLKHAEVSVEIRSQLAARENRLELKQDRVVLEYLRLAMANIGDYASWGTEVDRDENGEVVDRRTYVSFTPSERLTRDQLAAVQEVTEVRRPDGTIEVKFKLHDKRGPLDSLARHLGMFVDRSKLDVDLTYGIKLPEDFPRPAGSGDASDS